jgi:hypothetical protein
VTPASRREVFLRIALAVAKDRLPEPMGVTLHADHEPPSAWLRFDTSDETRLWGDHLELAEDLGIREWTGLNGGWCWYVKATAAPAPAEPFALADEVAAAIEGTVTA